MPWYAGYKANIVTYSLAKFACMVREAGLHIDFLDIWEKQQLPDGIKNQLGGIAETVNDMLSNPPEGTTSNVSEWAKKELCWDNIRKTSVSMNSDTKALLIDHEKSKEREKKGVRKQVILDSIHAQTYVVEKSAAHWELLREWNRTNRKLSPKEMGVLNVACSIPRQIPTEKQAKVLIQAENRAKMEGFFPSK